MKLISRNEEVILLTILKLGERAYGVGIRKQIYQDTGDKWSFASIYAPLDRLVRKNHVSKIKGEPSAKRGGKSKFYYRLTSTGKAALLALHRNHQQIWSGAQTLILEKKKN